MARLSRTPKKIEVDDHLEELRAYLEAQPIVAAAFHFGSYGMEYQNPLSDLDIALLVMPASDKDLDAISAIASALTGIVGEDDVNVVVLNTAPITLQHEVLSTGRLLCKRAMHLEDFHEYVCKQYADFKIDLDTFNAEYDEVLMHQLRRQRRHLTLIALSVLLLN
ncbi:MAG: hypothetical protein KGZ64_01970 [Thermaerobacter sp.]|nr:hypothetical protein [Thermaerobacter sp.]